MKLSMTLTVDGLVRALRWRGIELLEKRDERKEEERDDERQHGIAEGGLSRPLR